MLASDDMKEQTLGLCPADSAAHLPVMAPLYFENPHSSTAGFMDFDILKTTFYRTLTLCLPHALGTKPRESSDPGTPFLVTIDQPSELPLVTKHIDDTCTIAEMRRSGFMPHVQPEVILREASKLVRNPMGGDPLVTLDIVYMKDGVGVLLVISHAIVDMAAYCRFVLEWGLVAKAGSLPRDMDTDRKRFWDLVSGLATPVPTVFENHMAELNAADVEVPLEHPQASTIFRLSADAAAMGKLACTRDTMCPGISLPNFISALLWRITALACPNAKYAYFSSSLTIRNDPRFAEYWGNTSTFKFIYAPRDKVIEDVGRVADWVQDSVREFTVAEFAHILSLYTVDGRWYDRSLSKYVGAAGVPRLSVMNISRIPFYDIDFGWGRPTKVMYQTVGIPGLCFFMPQTGDGGIEVFVCLREDAANALLADELVSSHFDVEEIPTAK
ncbi:hypothetical protein GGI01_002044 [Coemansia sp. RSA 376]|nr:hypothetical protein LPJ71_000453 [Coemansia sp. S17]KAJ2017848.1 hypothetical protein GGI14_002708 [Coemansia sp. S680]KAJ2039467.1 hypothetical protein H4S03_001678 [Coemansia sp. S3946]KAJ2051459.1 hypothetical protein H4S04_001964 [Coemansia sp. S16]KAJ2069452.1 hypothetical protein GGI08_000338 [Coemansia sp. S2]KAJ2075992.1 hypothetical protein GGH13_000205 [Coemansia sp. S155-1]KAJ2103077.1 hypothetical protein GGI09_000858 [Coemansia sp. S100]KAJ2108819.1 hypothetical protein GGI1